VIRAQGTHMCTSFLISSTMIAGQLETKSSNKSCLCGAPWVKKRNTNLA